MRTSILVLSIVVLLPGCRQQHNVSNGGQPVTQTIAPAEAKPAPTSGTDALTQTVEIGDGRSEAEGGAAEAATTTTKAPAAKPAPAKKKGHK